MSSDNKASKQVAVDVRNAIDQLEEAYEFMLAYAAQGRQRESETEGASQIRGYLERFRSSLDIISSAVPALLDMQGAGKTFGHRLTSDLDVMKSILDIITSQSSISSEMIDNTNGLIAVRACLTDLFFIDQVLLPPR